MPGVAPATRASGSTTTAEASHGMSGWSQTTTARRSPAGCDTRGPEEVVSLEQRGLARPRAPRRERNDAADRPAAALRGGPRGPPGPSRRRAWRSSPPWWCTSPSGGAGAVSGSRPRPVRPGRRRTTPAGRPGRRRRRRRPSAPAPGTWRPRRTRGRGCGRSPLPASGRHRPSARGPHDDDATRLGRARLEPVERVAVGAELREGDLGAGDVARRERRGPAPVTCESWPRSERTRCSGPATVDAGTALYSEPVRFPAYLL